MTRTPDNRPRRPIPQPVYPPPADPWRETRPSTTPDVVYHRLPPSGPVRNRRTRQGSGCCGPLGCAPLLLLAALLFVLAVFLLAPVRTNVLVLGIDFAPGESSLGRSDTIILTTFIPLDPYIGMLSIPRDLWVTIPGVGENRINTAHYFAESQEAGSGPRASMETIRQNFGVDVNYYVRIRFEGFREVVNAMGGVDIDLAEPMAGYPPGRHHLTGNKALAFVRSRQGSDDFFRMEQGQFLIKAIFRQMLSPLQWPRLPGVLLALTRSTDTNLPIWHWPRLGLALLRTGPEGIDSRTITREMVAPFLTSEGAQVLLPDWSRINPVLLEIFGQ